MATVVPFASCYTRTQDVQLFGRGAGGGYLLFLSNRGPRYTPRPRLAGHHPKMTLRQICQMLKVMKQIRNREAAAAAAAAATAASRKQGAAVTPPLTPTKPEKKCVPSCLKRKRSVKRVSWPTCPPTDSRQSSKT